MTTTIMATHVEAFLAERQALGFRTTGPSASLLRSFARFFDGAGHTGALTPDLVIEWAKGHAQTDGPVQGRVALMFAAPYATYLSRVDPAMEFPPPWIFGKSQHRATTVFTLSTRRWRCLPQPGILNRWAVCALPHTRPSTA